MAKDKSSFVLYADQIHTFEHLSDKEAGVLIKHIYKYVNDEDPVLENRMLVVAFEGIRQTLRRNHKNWEEKRRGFVESGRRGGIKSGESRRSKATLHDPSQSKANPSIEAVSVSVSVSDSVSVREKERIQGFAPPSKDDVVELMFEKLDEFSAMGEADKFINFYQSKNWYVGKTKMKDWRAAARGWLSRMNDFKNEKNGSSKTHASVKTAGAHELLDKIRLAAGGK